VMSCGKHPAGEDRRRFRTVNLKLLLYTPVGHRSPSVRVFGVGGSETPANWRLSTMVPCAASDDWTLMDFG